MPIYDLIFVEADDKYYAMPREGGDATTLKTIYERTQLGSSGLAASFSIEKSEVAKIIHNKIFFGGPAPSDCFKSRNDE